MESLPEGWTRTTLGEICSKPQYGWTTSAQQRGAGPKLVRTSDISRSLDWEKVPFCKEAPQNLEKYRLHPGDILISRAGSVGISHIVEGDCPEAVFASYLIRFRPLGEIPSRFVGLFLQSPAYWRAISEDAAGIAIPNINASKLAALEFPLPPLAEQKRIVEKVEALLAQVQAARDRLERVQQILKRFRQAVLAAACDGRLAAATEVERIAGWPLCPLADLLAEPMANGRSVPTAENGFPVLRLTAIKSGSIDLRQRKTGAWTARQARPFLVRRGDFLVSRGNGSLSLVGRGGLVEVEPDPVAYPDTLIRVRPDESQILAPFLRLVWDAPQTRAQIEAAAHTTAGIQKVSQKDLATIELPCPDLPDQEQTVERASALLDFAAVVESRVERLQTLVRRTPQALLGRAFAGELVPTEAELALVEGREYESAEELLFRARNGLPGRRPQTDEQ